MPRRAYTILSLKRLLYCASCGAECVKMDESQCGRNMLRFIGRHTPVA